MTADLLVQARAALLDALAALREHRDAVVVIGAQAVYLRTPSAVVALAEATKDSDLAVDARVLGDEPLIEQAMRDAGFVLNPTSGQPGAWLTPTGVPVDLMVPELLAGPGGAQARGARVPPHSRRALRRASGLEAAVVDNSTELVAALDPQDHRAFAVTVAGPAALVVAKMHKLLERLDNPRRLNDKDAHDLYRLLSTIPLSVLVAGFNTILADSLSREAGRVALDGLKEHAALGAQATICVMAGRAEEGIGEPATVALATSLLSQDLLAALGR